MSSVVLIYEKDSNLRQQIEGWLAGAAIDFLSCYSYDKLMSEIQKKNQTRSFVLMTAKSNSNELNSLTSDVEVILYEPNQLDKNLLLTAYRDKHLKQVRQKKSGGKSFLDLVVIGSSTGGFPVVQQILESTKISQSVIVICQHVNKEMNDQLVKSVQTKVLSPVVLVNDQTECEKGKIYFLSGGSDYIFSEKYGRLYLTPSQDNASPFHPSINWLSKSFAQLNGYSRGYFILSGLGADGSQCVVTLREQGVLTVAQDPVTAAAPGMPQAAIQTGKVAQVLQPKDLNLLMKRSVA